jgi:hypothetical protein
MTKHEAAPAVAPATKVHGDVANIPVPLVMKSTVPVGVLEVPTSMSVTVAVHFVDVPTLTDPREHDTEVLTARTKVNMTSLVLPS